MLKHKGTYEIISPEDIGLARANESGIVLGKLRYGLGLFILIQEFVIISASLLSFQETINVLPCFILLRFGPNR